MQVLPRAAFSMLLTAAFFALPGSGPAAAAPGAPPSFTGALTRILGPGIPVDRVSRDLDGAIETGAASIAGRVPEASRTAIRDVLRHEVAARLDELAALEEPGPGPFRLSPDEVLAKVAGFEAFKMSAYLTSGVFPKRYFGYFDRRWDTGRHEELLLERAHQVVDAVNAYQAAHDRSTRFTDLELLVTYMSEGGAILFREDRRLLDADAGEAIDLYYHLGCDNIGAALARYPGLVRALDERFSTDLARRVPKPGVSETGEGYLGIVRGVDFMTSISAAAVMYLYEKEIAARKLAGAGADGEGGWPHADLMAFPLDEQFVITSLVFNTGILFQYQTVRRIRDFETLEYLHQVSARAAAEVGSKARPALPVPVSRDEAFRRLASEGYPHQPTSWQGAYHILQRYGAYVALRRFTTVFDDAGSRVPAASMPE